MLMQYFRDKFSQEGRQEGTREGISGSLNVLLRVKFGVDGLRLISRIKQIADTEKLKSVLDAIELAETPEDVLNFIEAET